eukprot:TRINITY_DN1562_c0_g1_i1.p1 TRINITY_DN1562_c0_g1~~TRINITY_DN1562_c0_g1_i1.p1  ORF type:complete len:626 (-),score=203.89 TRINITY_DN1562_c0_g1_i1:55-1932(-)
MGAGASVDRVIAAISFWRSTQVPGTMAEIEKMVPLIQQMMPGMLQMIDTIGGPEGMQKMIEDTKDKDPAAIVGDPTTMEQMQKIMQQTVAMMQQIMPMLQQIMPDMPPMDMATMDPVSMMSDPVIPIMQEMMQQMMPLIQQMIESMGGLEGVQKMVEDIKDQDSAAITGDTAMKDQMEKMIQQITPIVEQQVAMMQKLMQMMAQPVEEAPTASQDPAAEKNDSVTMESPTEEALAASQDPAAEKNDSTTMESPTEEALAAGQDPAAAVNDSATMESPTDEALAAGQDPAAEVNDSAVMEKPAEEAVTAGQEPAKEVNDSAAMEKPSEEAATAGEEPAKAVNESAAMEQPAEETAAASQDSAAEVIDSTTMIPLMQEVMPMMQQMMETIGGVEGTQKIMDDMRAKDPAVMLGDQFMIDQVRKMMQQALPMAPPMMQMMRHVMPDVPALDAATIADVDPAAMMRFASMRQQMMPVVQQMMLQMMEMMLQMMEVVGGPGGMQKMMDTSDPEMKEQLEKIMPQMMPTIQRTMQQIIPMIQLVMKMVQDKQEAMLMDAFADIDEERTGFIDMNTLKAVLGRMGVYMTEEQVAGVVKDADKNCDEKLDFQEYKELVGRAKTPKSGARHKIA